MDNQKDGVLVVPAEITFNDLGVVSILFNFTTSDGSLLRQVIEGKTVDESRSVIGAFAREICNEVTQNLPKSWIVLSGQFQFVEKVGYKSPMLLLAECLVEHSDCCNFCARQDKCNDERDNLSDGKWAPPDSDVCAEHIVKYFYDKAKK